MVIRYISVICVPKTHPLTTKTKTTMNKKEIWQKILQTVITILTAIVTTLGTTSCIEMIN